MFAVPYVHEQGDDVANHPRQKPIRHDPDLDERSRVRIAPPRRDRPAGTPGNLPNRPPCRILPIRPRDPFASARDRRQIALTDQASSGGVHPMSVKVSPLPPDVPPGEWLRRSGPNSVTILSPPCVVPGVKPGFDTFDPSDRQIVGQMSVHGEKPISLIHRGARIEKADHLPRRVDQRIGPAREDRRDGSLRDPVQRLVQLSLHRPLSRLDLRSREAGAVVAHRELERRSGHAGSRSRGEPASPRATPRRTRSGPSARRRRDGGQASRCGCSRPARLRTWAR